MALSITLTVVEGAIRKWPLGGETSITSYLIYFSKDMVFASILFCRGHNIRAFSPPPLLERSVIFGCVLLGAGALISSAHGINPVGAVLTVRSAIFLPVVAWLAIPRLAGLSVRSVALFLAALTAVNFCLASVQYTLPPDHVLNRYAASTQAIVSFQQNVRTTGTFSFITGLGYMSIVGVWAGIVLLSLGTRRPDRIVGWLTIVGGIGCALLGISRSPVVISALMLVTWTLFSRIGIKAAVRNVLAGGLLLVIVSAAGVTPILSNLWQTLLDRQEMATEKSEVFSQRAFGQLDDVPAVLLDVPFGNGFGSEQVAGNFYTSGVASFTNFEGQFPRLVSETGALGLLGFIVICGGAILTLQRCKTVVTSQGEKAVLLATQVLLSAMFYGNVIFDHTSSAFAWQIFAATVAALGMKSSASRKSRPGTLGAWQ
ncbi:MAG: hypothetical protein ACR2MF_03405 [Chthoniobacterales bacterium]